jgi:hypothetical protein
VLSVDMGEHGHAIGLHPLWTAKGRERGACRCARGRCRVARVDWSERRRPRRAAADSRAEDARKSEGCRGNLQIAK